MSFKQLCRILGVAVLVLCLVGVISSIGRDGSNDAYPELAEIETHGEWTLTQATDYFRTLAETRSPSYAFEVLHRAMLPTDVNVHGVAHVIGYVLYAQEGLAGMKQCTEEFRYACSHSLVISGFVEHGAAALSDIVSTCETAPGGPGAYEACMHGLGHGLLAYADYNLPQALTTCRTAADFGPPGEGNGHRLTDPYEECVGAVVMEMGQGAHDPVAQALMAPRYAPEDEPLMPCTSVEMPEEARDACYLNITQRLLVSVGAVESIPEPEFYAPAMRLCRGAPREHQAACYGGFGKEFPYYAVQRDTQDPTKVSDAALNNVWEWCALAEDMEGVQRCGQVALDSLFWAGRNGLFTPYAFCRRAPDTQAESCNQWLSENIDHFGYN